MIEINLLPEELKKTRAFYFIEPKILIVYGFFGIVGIFILLHLLFASLDVVRSTQAGNLEKKWANLEPQRKSIDALKQEFNILSSDAQIIQQLTSQRINWAQKLNELSLNLPAGIWFNEMNISGNQFILGGLAVAPGKDEITEIKLFLDRLKSDNNFSSDFSSLELGPVERKNIGSYDVFTFSILGKLKK